MLLFEKTKNLRRETEFGTFWNVQLNEKFWQTQQQILKQKIYRIFHNSHISYLEGIYVSLKFNIMFDDQMDVFEGLSTYLWQ